MLKRIPPGRLAQALLIVALLAIAVTGRPMFLRIGSLVGIYLVYTIGLSLLVGYTGQISFGHAAFIGIGAYTTAILTARHGISPWLAILAGMFLSGLVAYIVGLAVLRLKGHYLMLATIALGEIAYVTFVQWKTLTNGPIGIGGIPYPSIAGFTLDTDARLFSLIWVFALLLAVIAFRLVNSNLGYALRSIREDELAASTLGINTFSYKLRIFVISAMYASVAGSLLAHMLTYVATDMFTVMLSALGIMMIVIGGANSLWGACIGAPALTILSEWLRAYKDYNDLMFGIVFILILMFASGGIYGEVSRLWSRRRDLFHRLLGRSRSKQEEA